MNRHDTRPSIHDDFLFPSICIPSEADGGPQQLGKHIFKLQTQVMAQQTHSSCTPRTSSPHRNNLLPVREDSH